MFFLSFLYCVVLGDRIRLTTSKFGANPKGGFSTSDLKSYKLPKTIESAILKSINNSLALNTWTSYHSAVCQLLKCERETKIVMRRCYILKELFHPRAA